MIVGVFSFDGPMYKDINGQYCNTTITSEMFKRYFHVVDKLIVVIRTIKIKKTYKEANLNLVELESLEFVEIPNLNSITGFLFKRNKNKIIIKENVEKADLIFARMPSLISDIAIDFARKSNKLYMVEVGGCSWDAYWNHSLLGKLIAPYVYINQKKGIRNASFASYVTEEWLQKRYPTKGEKISASNVYLPKVEELVLEKRMEKIKNGISKNKIVIGTTAAVDVKYKGQEYIIEAISRLNRKGFNFEYELVGAGDNKYLKKIACKFGINDKIKFKGLLLKAEVIEWLDSIDIYAQPSKQEGLPRALIEALSRGCPAIGSTTAGIPELLQSELVFRNCNVDEICDKLENLVSNPSEMIKSAKFNFLKSRNYEKEILDEKRNFLYEKYRKEALNRKGNEYDIK